MNKYLKTLIFLFLWLLFSLSFAQGSFVPHTINYTVHDGLPSNEVYYIFEDHDHYLWFGTDNGISKFDGKTFETFNSKHGLRFNNVVGIQEDHQQVLWVATLNSHLFYLDRATMKFKPYVYNAVINNEIDDSTLLHSFYVDEESNVSLGTNKGLYQINSEGVITKDSVNEQVLDYGYVGIETNSGSWLNFRKYDPKGRSQLYFLTHIDNKNKSVSKYSLKEFKGSTVHKIHNHSCAKWLRREENIFAITPSGFFQVDEKKSNEIPLSIKGEVLDIYSDREKNIWFGMRGEGVYLYRESDSTFKSPINFLNGHSISHIFHDKNGGHWFSTIDNGIFYMPHQSVENLQLSNSNYITRLVTVMKDQLYFDSDWNTLYKLDQNSYLNKIDFTPFTNDIYRIKNVNLGFDNKELIVNADVTSSTKFINKKQLKRSKDQTIIRSSFIKNVPFAYGKILYGYQTIKVDSTFWLSHQYGLTQFDQSGNAIYYSEEDVGQHRFSNLTLDKEGNIWISGLSSIWKWTPNKKLINMGLEDSTLNCKANCFLPLDELILIGSENQGLIVYEDNSSYTLPLNGKIEYSVNALEKSENGHIWAATSYGIFELIPSLTGYTIRQYDKQNGLPSDYIFDLAVFQDYVYCGSESGLFRFKPEEIISTENTSPLYITNIFINDRDTSLEKHYELNYDQNYLKIGFTNINPILQGALRYRYKIEGLDYSWHYSSSNLVSFPKIAPGNYQFIVQAQGENHLWTSKAGFTFNILPPFWQTVWFKLSVIGLILGVVLFVFSYQRRVAQKRLKLQQALSTSQLDGLNRQMSPHFIFNALNAIQNYILENNILKSHEYLGKFSQLMRSNLESSREILISIEEEMEYIKMYMDIEVVRFNDKITFSIQCDDRIHQSTTMIPPFLLQPLMENAIIHGVGSLENGGHIALVIELIDNYIKCSVIDNGVGRNDSIKQHDFLVEDKNSLGQTIIKERLFLIQSLYGDPTSFYYKDLLEDSELPGTEAVVILPIINKKIES